uniref:Uncharacterized protein n=1 Tax=Romanomermis culicivorax TaxID=13658 RepID=A0A915K737_ROMCU
KNSSRNSEKTSPIIHSRSESITAILRKTTNGNVQLNRNERKFPYRSVTFGILHSDSSSSVGKDSKAAFADTPARCIDNFTMKGV